MSAATVMDAATTIASPLVSSLSPVIVLTPQSRACRDNADLLHDAENDAFVLAADEVLMQERWTWVQELVESVRDAQIRQEAKLFFLRLVQASTFEAMETVMGDFDVWRTALDAITVGNSKRARLPRELKELTRTLFLLGADKQLDLSRTAVNLPTAAKP